jgi:hypothetical protein
MKLFLNGHVTTDKNELLSQLSSLIEIGRLYFPNIDKKDNFGKEKPKIYQGHRNLVFVFLVYSRAFHNLKPSRAEARMWYACLLLNAHRSKEHYARSFSDGHLL